jgi:hypothetical protein
MPYIHCYVALIIMGNLKWIESGNVTKTFRLQDEPELIHVIKTGFKDKYMVVYEDAYELNIGKVTYGTKTEIESRFGVTL